MKDDDVRNQVLQARKEGMPVLDILAKFNISRGTYYSWTMQERVKEKPIIDDSKQVQELREKVKKLEEENELLRADIRKLTDKLLTLI